MNPYDTPGKHSSTLWKILLALAVIIIIGLAAYIPYIVQQQRIDDLKAQVSSLKATATTRSAQNQQSGTAATQPSGSNVTSVKGTSMRVYYPTANTVVVSPVAVVGEVPGNWSSEASFPVKLLDSKGTVIAQTTGHVLGNWQTTQLVPFSAQLTYSTKPTGKGTLVLQKDNPSGQSANDDSVSIPVAF